jgi:hypothetical protein
MKNEDTKKEIVAAMYGPQPLMVDSKSLTVSTLIVCPDMRKIFFIALPVGTIQCL